MIGILFHLDGHLNPWFDLLKIHILNFLWYQLLSMDNYLKQIFLTLFNFSFKRLSRSKFKLNELLVDIKFSFNFKFYLNLFL